MKPALLDGRHEIVLANWPNNMHVICNDNNNIPIKFPSHPYVLINRSVLCNCRREAEDNFLLESIAACPGKQSDLIMYFTVDTAFMHYFDSLINDLEVHILQNWTLNEQVLPILLQTSDFDSKLLEAPKTLKDFVYQFKQKKQLLDTHENNNKMGKHSFFNNYIMDVFLFIAAILSMIATPEIVHKVCLHAKPKALVTGIDFQPLKGTDVIFSSIIDSEECTCNAQWYTIAALTLMIIGLIFFILATTRECRIFRGHLFSNAVMVMLFFSDVDQYVPIKLCKNVGSIRLFKFFGHSTPDQITLERKLLQYVTKLNWKEVLMTLNRTMIHLPTSVIIPLRDKLRLRCIMRKRSLLLHILLKQGTSWYALDNKEYLLPPPCLDNQKYNCRLWQGS